MDLVADACLVALIETGVPGVGARRRRGVRRRGGAGRSGRVDGAVAGGRLVVGDGAGPCAPLFESRCPSTPWDRATRRVTLFAVAVDGVPEIHVEEALWCARGVLARDAGGPTHGFRVLRSREPWEERCFPRRCRHLRARRSGSHAGRPARRRARGPPDAARADRPAGARARRRVRHRLPDGRAGPAGAVPAAPGRGCWTSASWRACATSWPSACARRAPTIAGGADEQAEKRVLLERMLLTPGRLQVRAHLAAEDLGEPGCGVWQVRPRMGLIGMLMGWWQVKLSSGCPLPGGHGAR